MPIIDDQLSGQAQDSTGGAQETIKIDTWYTRHNVNILSVTMDDRAGGWIGADSPAARGTKSPRLAYAWGAGIIVFCTLVDRFLLNHVAEANLVMVYFIGVLAIALRGEIRAALFAAVLAVLAFDFFFVPPYLTFAVADAEYFLMFLVMFLVGSAISALVARLAAELVASRQRERQGRGLFELSWSLLKAQGPVEMLAEGAKVVARTVGKPIGAWLVGPIGPQEATPPQIVLSSSDYEILRAVLNSGKSAGPGTGTFDGSANLFLPIRTGDLVHGALVLHLPEGVMPLDRETRETLATSVNQLAIALGQSLTRKEADAARRQAESERLRSSLLSAVSHDLRTPLTSIIGAASSLVDGTELLDSNTRRELALDVVLEAERLNRLVNNLLHATRLAAGPVTLVRNWSSLDEILGAALARLGDSAEQIAVNLRTDLPALQVDVALLEQAMYNLLDNAVKHTPEGTPVSVRAFCDGRTLVIEIADQGPGLPPGEEERIFEKFCSFGRGKVTPGTGLGLAIVRGVVEAHGGQINAMNRPDGGSLFRLSLPLQRVRVTGSLLESR
ncbi:MAG: DUF4118 domain-containing protein [Cyanobacteria bacterium NC_groundwater_1444_Ag_S-0.65um_54_12]|nr:DUF4118 domain-containing protein [Cyanobacteria bacterium NC_groundwater_1444_Ag_S-0.65um_54_12]